MISTKRLKTMMLSFAATFFLGVMGATNAEAADMLDVNTQLTSAGVDTTVAKVEAAGADTGSDMRTIGRVTYTMYYDGDNDSATRIIYSPTVTVFSSTGTQTAIPMTKVSYTQAFQFGRRTATMTIYRYVTTLADGAVVTLQPNWYEAALLTRVAIFRDATLSVSLPATHILMADNGNIPVPPVSYAAPNGYLSYGYFINKVF